MPDNDPLKKSKNIESGDSDSQANMQLRDNPPSILQDESTQDHSSNFPGIPATRSSKPKPLPNTNPHRRDSLVERFKTEYQKIEHEENKR